MIFQKILNVVTRWLRRLAGSAVNSYSTNLGAHVNLLIFKNNYL